MRPFRFFPKEIPDTPSPGHTRGLLLAKENGSSLSLLPSASLTWFGFSSKPRYFLVFTWDSWAKILLQNKFFCPEKRNKTKLTNPSKPTSCFKLSLPPKISRWSIPQLGCAPAWPLAVCHLFSSSSSFTEPCFSCLELWALV